MIIKYVRGCKDLHPESKNIFPITYTKNLFEGAPKNMFFSSTRLLATSMIHRTDSLAAWVGHM
jgi:hypothetical protein